MSMTTGGRPPFPLGETQKRGLSRVSSPARVTRAHHVSDGSRYNTPSRRKAELQHQLRYTEGNPCYTYSSGAVKRLVPENQPTPDLDGLPEEAGAVTGAGANGNDDGLLGGVFMAETGVYRKTEDGMLKLSGISDALPCCPRQGVS